MRIALWPRAESLVMYFTVKQKDFLRMLAGFLESQSKFEHYHSSACKAIVSHC